MANKTQINVRIDEVTRQLIMAISAKYKKDGYTSLAQQSLIIEKSVNAFAHDVLGRQEWEKIINKYYDDPLGIWRNANKTDNDK